MAEPLSASLIIVWGDIMSWTMSERVENCSSVKLRLGWEVSNLSRQEVVRLMALRPSRAPGVRWQMGGTNLDGCVKGCLFVGFAVVWKKFSLAAWIENRCSACLKGLMATPPGVGTNLSPCNRTSSCVCENW